MRCGLSSQADEIHRLYPKLDIEIVKKCDESIKSGMRHSIQYVNSDVAKIVEDVLNTNLPDEDKESIADNKNNLAAFYVDNYKLFNSQESFSSFFAFVILILGLILDAINCSDTCVAYTMLVLVSISLLASNHLAKNTQKRCKCFCCYLYCFNKYTPTLLIMGSLIYYLIKICPNACLAAQILYIVLFVLFILFFTFFLYSRDYKNDYNSK